MTRFAITGGAGFIGSCLARALLAPGDSEVIVIDNLYSGSEANLSGISGPIEFHNLDIRHYDSLPRVLAGADTVFHLAAIPSVPRSIQDPVPSHEANIDGTFNVLLASRDARVRRVVYASSSSVYGDTEVLPKVETMLPRPKSPYAAQKLMGEYYCSVFSSCYGIETVALRFFNVYGPRQDPKSPYSGVLSLFMKALIERQRPTILGDGEQSRDFTYVEDVAALVIRAAFAPDVSGCVFNGGNGGRYALNAVWTLLQRMEGTDLPANYGPPRAGDVRHSQADTEGARTRLGHQARFTLEEGLRKTLDWYKGHSPNVTAANHVK